MIWGENQKYIYRLTDSEEAETQDSEERDEYERTKPSGRRGDRRNQIHWRG